MPVRIAQFVHAANAVIDEAFLRDFPEVEAAKASNLESLANAIDGAEILHAYNSAFTAEFARLVRDKGRALRWIQFTLTWSCESSPWLRGSSLTRSLVRNLNAN